MIFPYQLHPGCFTWNWTLTSPVMIIHISLMPQKIFQNSFDSIWNSRSKRCSENNNTAHPLDQWTNSPFMGQQIGNCNSFTSTHYLPIYLPCTVAQEQAHCVSNIVSNSHFFHSKPINLPIPKLWLWKIWPWKSKAKDMGEVKVQSHNVCLTSYRLTSLWFHVKDTAFSKFDLENPRLRS